MGSGQLLTPHWLAQLPAEPSAGEGGRAHLEDISARATAERGSGKGEVPVCARGARREREAVPQGTPPCFSSPSFEPFSLGSPHHTPPQPPPQTPPPNSPLFSSPRPQPSPPAPPRLPPSPPRLPPPRLPALLLLPTPPPPQAPSHPALSPSSLPRSSPPDLRGSDPPSLCHWRSRLARGHPRSAGKRHPFFKAPGASPSFREPPDSTVLSMKSRGQDCRAEPNSNPGPRPGVNLSHPSPEGWARRPCPGPCPGSCQAGGRGTGVGGVSLGGSKRPAEERTS